MTTSSLMFSWIWMLNTLSRKTMTQNILNLSTLNQIILADKIQSLMQTNRETNQVTRSQRSISW